jgi:hypothetical protein
VDDVIGHASAADLVKFIGDENDESPLDRAQSDSKNYSTTSPLNLK